MINFQKKTIGKYQTNSYLVISSDNKNAVLVDPAAQADDLFAWCQGYDIKMILLTHGHSDHVGALEDMRKRLNIPVGIHPLDAAHFKLKSEIDLNDGERIQIGEDSLGVVHIPGHTPGSIALRPKADEVEWVIVGDAIFPGGPGHTRTPQDLITSLDSLARTVFTWDDEIELYPGHGDSTTVGAERASFETMRKGSLPADLCGDVTWR
jgi:glyoxylase-like metal-dependent hydrolase (beta-lactamase superfamily II)